MQKNNRKASRAGYSRNESICPVCYSPLDFNGKCPVCEKRAQRASKKKRHANRLNYRD